jgi:hypothetical protein
MMRRLDMKGTWAAPGCVGKLISFREAQRRLQQANIDHDA